MAVSQAGSRVGLPAVVTHPCTVTPVARGRATSSSPTTVIRYAIWNVAACDVGETQVHGDLVVERQRLAVLHERLEHRGLEPGVTPFRERMSDRTQVLDPGLLEVGKVVAVVHDAHCVGLDEADPDPMRELVVVGGGGRIGGQTHAATIQVAVVPALQSSG